MASAWGYNVLGPNQSAGWYFTRANIVAGPGQQFLPYISARAVSDVDDGPLWSLTGGGYPYFNQLGVSTMWNMVSHEEGGARDWLLVVQNNNSISVAYEFIEADF